ncbi:MAG: DoxX family protein [Bacteroidia bacterium]
MKKRDKIIYWIATVWLALGMTSAGIVQIIKIEEEVEMMNHLGYPTYLLTILGIGKILGVIAILIPKFPLLKEWAYAGFFFTMVGAITSHLILNDSFGEIFPPVLLLVLIAVSWYFRPAERKTVSVNQTSE